MTNFKSPHAETPTELGHAIVALDRIIDSHLSDYNYSEADKHIAILRDIAVSVRDLDDRDIRSVLTGALRALAVRHDVMREDTTLPDTPPDQFVPGTPCGHRHAIGNYANGCAYATHMAWATAAAHNGDHPAAQHHAAVAEHTLWPLDGIHNPESLRHFVAGLHSGLETHLRSLGTTIPS